MRRTVEGKVDGLDDSIDQVFYCLGLGDHKDGQRMILLLTDDGTGKLLVDELEESLGVGRGLDEAGFVDGEVAHCV